MYKDFKEMPIWQKAMEIAETVFRITDNLPRKEDYGFTCQTRRSALSIPANIAEAFGRNHTLDKINFYYMSRGSLTETRSHLEFGKRVGYFDEQNVLAIDRELIELYNGLNKIVLALKKR